jgi:hypothetical protein
MEKQIKLFFSSLDFNLLWMIQCKFFITSWQGRNELLKRSFELWNTFRKLSEPTCLAVVSRALKRKKERKNQCRDLAATIQLWRERNVLQPSTFEEKELSNNHLPLSNNFTYPPNQDNFLSMEVSTVGRLSHDQDWGKNETIDSLKMSRISWHAVSSPVEKVLIFQYSLLRLWVSMSRSV